MRRSIRLLSRFAAVGIVVIASAGLGSAPAEATGPSTSSILSAINGARARAGRPALSLRSDLSAVAYRWSGHMAATQRLGHNPDLTGQVSGWRWVGENVGYGPSWSAVESAFINSPAHRSNIIDRDYSQIGIGVVMSNGRVWITQVFRSPSGSAVHSTAGTRKSTVAKKRTGNARASAPPPRRARRAAATPRRAPAPSPTELLHRRLTTARAAQTARAGNSVGDPLTAALGFAAAMRTVGG